MLRLAVSAVTTSMSANSLFRMYLCDILVEKSVQSALRDTNTNVS